MNIYLVRHGETPWNKKRLVQGQRDIPLNDYGRDLAKKTAEGMKDISFDAVFSSPLSRAFETAQIITEGRNLPVVTDDLLKEIHFGKGEGASITEGLKKEGSFISLFFEHPDRYVPPAEGETLISVQKRGLEFMKERIKPLEGKKDSVLIVAHACIIRSIIRGIQKRPMKEFWYPPSYSNCCVCQVECKDGIFRVIEEARVYT